jgi:hypothetical protein
VEPNDASVNLIDVFPAKKLPLAKLTAWIPPATISCCSMDKSVNKALDMIEILREFDLGCLRFWRFVDCLFLPEAAQIFSF